MNINAFSVSVRLLEELAVPVFWGPTIAPLEDASEFIAEDSVLARTALELERPAIDVVVPAAVGLVALESAVLVASAEPSIEPRNEGESRSEVIAGIDADTAAMSTMDEVIAEIVARLTEPAVISTR